DPNRRRPPRVHCRNALLQAVERAAPGRKVAEPIVPIPDIRVPLQWKLRSLGERKRRGDTEVSIGEPVIHQPPAAGQHILQNRGKAVKLTGAAADDIAVRGAESHSRLYDMQPIEDTGGPG